VIAMLNLDEAIMKLRQAAEAGDTEALEAVGWDLVGECGVLSGSLGTLRAACREVPESAWPAHRLPAALRAA
jgi:hypothetical protein